MGRPKLKVIDNEGHNHLLGGLRSICDVAQTVEVEVAFVTAAGVKKLLPSLRKVAERGAVRILTGLYQSITEPDALSALFKVQRQTKGKLSVRLSRERDFHRKLYLARTAKLFHAIAGSSNLTTAGLISGGEINIHAVLAADSPEAARFTKIFRSDWRKGFELTAERIRRYEQKAPKRRKRVLLGAATLKEILGGETEHSTGDVADDVDRAPRYWCDGLNGYVSEETAALIEEQTGWDKKGYDCAGLRTSVYENDDCILLVDRATSPVWVHLVRVRSQTEVGTRADGRYFVAHTPLKGMARRKLTKGLLSKLEGIGIREPGEQRLKLSDAKWRDVVALFRK